MLRVKIDANTDAIVFPKKNESWRVTQLETATARYHYRESHVDTPMGHKLLKIERVVVDIEANETLARETKYKRKAPWFYVGLDRPVMLCPSPGEHPLSTHGSVFNLAFKPTQAK